jgi:hypothetical protein
VFVRLLLRLVGIAVDSVNLVTINVNLDHCWFVFVLFSFECGTNCRRAALVDKNEVTRRVVSKDEKHHEKTVPMDRSYATDYQSQIGDKGR